MACAIAKTLNMTGTKIAYGERGGETHRRRKQKEHDREDQ
jgi:hypothetical protein